MITKIEDYIRKSGLFGDVEAKPIRVSNDDSYMYLVKKYADYVSEQIPYITDLYAIEQFSFGAYKFYVNIPLTAKKAQFTSQLKKITANFPQVNLIEVQWDAFDADIDGEYSCKVLFNLDTRN